MLDKFIGMVVDFYPLVAIVVGVGVLLWATDWILIRRYPEQGRERLFHRQLIMMGITFAGVVAIVLALPVSDSTRNQIIGLIGLLVSGVFAFSSSTFMANLMAGVLLRVARPFRVGDFISVNDYFGRVTERGLFDTEIQSEHRELISIPNTYLISNPVSTVRTSGAIVSSTLSLGYDVHHARVEPLLIEAAEKSGLGEPFVHILELGNYSITYRVSGVLAEIKGLITARSNLYREILDTLHDNEIEIMSPSFMNQRRLAEDQRVIPALAVERKVENETVAEEIVFDKAELAEQTQKERDQLVGDIKRLEESLKEAPEGEKDGINAAIEKLRERLVAFDEALNAPKTDEQT